MLVSICRKLVQINVKNPSHFHVLQNPFLKSISNLSDSIKVPSLTLSYLVNSCGLSPESARSASKRLTLKTTQKPDSVLEFFKSLGFSNAQITNLISVKPRFLLADVDKTLQPNVKFLQNLGLTNSEINNLIDSSPTILLKGLNTHIMPSIHFLRNVVHTNANITKALKRWKLLTTSNLEKRMQPNIAIFKEYDVPDSHITSIVMRKPVIFLTQQTDKLMEVVKRVEEFGFDRGSGLFVMAIQALYSMKKSSWESKSELLKSLGWSEADIRNAFRKMPSYMSRSEKKIRTAMDFFVNKLKWGPSEVAQYPIILMFSLEKRLIPRSKVWNILKHKELVKERDLKQMLAMSEKDFLKKYVTKYAEEVPYLLKAYKGELEEGLGEDVSPTQNEGEGDVNPTQNQSDSVLRC